MPASDYELLQRFSTAGSEAAFHELVQRHLPVVWNAARRVLNNDAALAQDVAQTVFADLARAAGKLRRNAVVGAWLHRHTFFTASKLVRTEVRRRAREHTAASLSAMNTSSAPLPDNSADAAWAELAPHLDGALDTLPAADREAVVLRYFEKRDLRSVGQSLGITEEAARKRVSRALDRLRSSLTKRGATLSAVLLGAFLTDHAAAAAPPHLAPQIASGALELWLAPKAAAAAAGSKMSAAPVWLRQNGTRLAAGAVAALTLTGAAWGTWHLLNASPELAAEPPIAAPSQRPPEAGRQIVSPPGIRIHPEIFVIPDRLIAVDLLRRPGHEPDGALLERCRKQVKAGEAEQIPFPPVPCESGERAKKAMTNEFPYPVEYRLRDSSEIQPAQLETKVTGTSVEVELNRSAGGQIIDLNFAFEHVMPEVFLREVAVKSQDTPDRRTGGLTLPVFRTVKITEQAVLYFEEPRLLGTVRMMEGAWVRATSAARARRNADLAAWKGYREDEADPASAAEAYRMLVFVTVTEGESSR